MEICRKKIFKKEVELIRMFCFNQIYFLKNVEQGMKNIIVYLIYVIGGILKGFMVVFIFVYLKFWIMIFLQKYWDRKMLVFKLC